jgi:hypothetical protein
LKLSMSGAGDEDEASAEAANANDPFPPPLFSIIQSKICSALRACLHTKSLACPRWFFLRPRPLLHKSKNALKHPSHSEGFTAAAPLLLKAECGSMSFFSHLSARVTARAGSSRSALAQARITRSYNSAVAVVVAADADDPPSRIRPRGSCCSSLTRYRSALRWASGSPLSASALNAATAAAADDGAVAVAVAVGDVDNSDITADAGVAAADSAGSLVVVVVVEQPPSPSRRGMDMAPPRLLLLLLLRRQR